MLACDFQSLGLIHLRTHQIPHAILHEHLVAILILPNLNTFVENLDLILRVEMIVDHHFAASPDQRAAQLHRGQPVQVKMRDGAALELHVDVRNTFSLPSIPADGGASGSRNSSRLPVEQVR